MIEYKPRREINESEWLCSLQKSKGSTWQRLISRLPGQARSIELLVDPDELPRLMRPSE